MDVPSRLEHRARLRASDKYIIDTIFPCGEIHIIGGHSGAGKTTWMMQMLYDWDRGLPVMGYTSHPCEWLYVSADRGTRATNRTLDRLGYHDWDIPVFSVEEASANPAGRFSLVNLVHSYPNVELFVIEGFQAFTPDPGPGKSQNKADLEWVTNLRHSVLTPRNVTILGTTHYVKQRNDDTTGGARQQILGSASLIATLSTVITIEPPMSEQKSRGKIEADMKSHERRVTVSGRDFPDKVLHYSRDHNGRFVLSGTLDAQEDMSLDVKLTGVAPGDNVFSKDLNNWAGDCNVSRSSLYRWIDSQISDGMLEKVRDGVYRKVRSN